MLSLRTLGISLAATAALGLSACGDQSGDGKVVGDRATVAERVAHACDAHGGFITFSDLNSDGGHADDGILVGCKDGQVIALVVDAPN